MRVVRGGLVVLALAAAMAAPAAAQDRDTTVERLERQIEAITRQLEELQLGADTAPVDSGPTGLAPAASKVYRVRQGVSIGGYGEFLYENFAGEREDGLPAGESDRIDALRAIVYFGYKFNDKFLFNSEIEFEHGGGEVATEFAYLEYRASPGLGVRAGLLLAPMGFVNEIHEPPTFLGTTRPTTERIIIPSTWREVGFGAYGSAGPISWRAYLLNGFDASGFSAGGLRGGRQSGAQALAENVGGVARVDYTGVLGLTVGASAYLGNSGQGLGDPADPLGVRTGIYEGHAEYKAYGLDLRGLFAVATVDDAAELNAAQGLTGADGVAERLTGWYVQGGYDILRGARTTHQLLPYVRYEQVNTQDEVADGFAADPANDQRIVALGAMWKPIPNISVKADYQIHRNEAETGVDQLNVNVGYLF